MLVPIFIGEVLAGMAVTGTAVYSSVRLHSYLGKIFVQRATQKYAPDIESFKKTKPTYFSPIPENDRKISTSLLKSIRTSRLMHKRMGAQVSRLRLSDSNIVLSLVDLRDYVEHFSTELNNTIKSSTRRIASLVEGSPQINLGVKSDEVAETPRPYINPIDHKLADKFKKLDVLTVATAHNRSIPHTTLQTLCDDDFGWTALGKIKAYGNILSAVLQDPHPHPTIKHDMELLQPLLNKIDHERKNVIAHINSTTTKNFENIQIFVEAVPRLSDNPLLHSFIDRLVAAHDEDIRNIRVSLHQDLANRMAALPKRNFLDRILRINRNTALVNIYTAAAHDMDCDLDNTSQQFRSSAHQDPNATIARIAAQSWPKDRATIKVLASLQNELPGILENYAHSYKAWETNAQQLQTESSAAINSACRFAHGEFKKLNEELSAAFSAVRPILAESALNRAIFYATPHIQQFKETESAYFIPLDGQSKINVTEFLNVMQTLDKERDAAIAKGQGMKLPTPQHPLSAADLRSTIDKIEIGVDGIVKNTFSRKVQKLVKQEAKHRLHFLKTGLEAAREHPLSAVDKELINILDHAGIIDVATATGELITDALPAEVFDLADAASDFILFPGMISTTKTVIQEFSMLVNGETDFGESLKNGLGPAAAKAGLIAGGVALDTACGWFSCGIFTIGAAILGTFIKNTGPKEDIEEDLTLLQPSLNQIKSRIQEANQTINNTVMTNFGELRRQIIACPKLNQEPKMTSLVTQITQSYAQDAQATAAAAYADAEQKILKLPKPGLIDNILGVDRTHCIASLYRFAAEEMGTNFARVSQEFAQTAHKDHEKTMRTALTKVFAKGDAISQTFLSLANTSILVTLHYQQSILNWESDCTKTWTSGTTRIRDVAKIERSGIDGLKTRLAPSMAPARTRIRANLKRLKLDPSLCP